MNADDDARRDARREAAHDTEAGLYRPEWNPYLSGTRQHRVWADEYMQHFGQGE